MPIGPVAASLIGAGISGATSIYGAKKAGDASKEAAQQQTNAGREALGLMADMYTTTRNDLAPFRNVGGQAALTIGALSGLPTGPVGGASSAGPMSMGPGAGPAMTPTDDGGSFWDPLRNSVLERKAAIDAARNGGSIWQIFRPRTDTRSGSGDGQTDGGATFSDMVDPARAQTASSFVMMRAPNGEEDLVRPDHVPFLLKQGAVVV